MRSNRKLLIIAGATMMALACLMMVDAAVYFTLPQPPGPLMDVIGRISFWGFIPMGVVGLVVLITGVVVAKAR